MRHVKRSLIFSTLRYLEYGLIAISYLVIARKVGPQEYSKTIPGFIFITYSQYLMLGLNQALMKTYVVDGDDETKRIYVKNILYYIFFISIVAILIGIVILPRQLFMVSFISSMIYFQSIFQTLLRLEEKILGINLSNLVFSIIYFCLCFFIAHNVRQFFFFWFLSLFISNFMNAVQAIPIIKKLKLSFKREDLIRIKSTIMPQIKLGIKLTFIGLVSTYFLTYDRLLLNFFSMNKELKGNYQLADNVASTIYLFFVTMLFYYFPILLKYATINASYRLRLIKYGSLFVLIMSVLLILVIPFLNVIILKYFPAYSSLSRFLVYQAVLKIYIMSISMASTISIALNAEVRFLKWWGFFIAITGLSLFIIYKFAHLKIEQITVLVLLLQIGTLFVTNTSYLLFNRSKFFRKTTVDTI